MIMQMLLGLVLTTFISVNGQLIEVDKTSEEYKNYIENSVTDIGNPENIFATSEEVESAQSTEEPLTSVSGGDALPSETVEPSVIIMEENEEEIALMTAMVDLLAENSDSATGTLNSTILTLMDRMIDSYPSYYQYAGFRTDADDSYASTLYISKNASVDGDTITFGSDCIAVEFYRYTTSNYNGYIVYNTYESPYASVTVNSNTIVYTNALDGYPSLGTKPKSSDEWIWIAVLGVVVIVIFTRRNS